MSLKELRGQNLRLSFSRNVFAMGKKRQRKVMLGQAQPKVHEALPIIEEWLEGRRKNDR